MSIIYCDCTVACICPNGRVGSERRCCIWAADEAASTIHPLATQEMIDAAMIAILYEFDGAGGEKFKMPVGAILTEAIDDDVMRGLGLDPTDRTGSDHYDARCEIIKRIYMAMVDAATLGVTAWLASEWDRANLTPIEAGDAPEPGWRTESHEAGSDGFAVRKPVCSHLTLGNATRSPHATRPGSIPNPLTEAQKAVQKAVRIINTCK